MAAERWEIDSSHSSLHFSVRHLVIAKVRGSFARWSGTIQVPDGDFSKATVDVTIDASSIDTGVADRDAHLKSPDFFDAAQHAELRFVGRRVQPRSGSEIDVVGELTIRGTTREVVLRVEPGAGDRRGDGRRPRGHRSRDRSARTFPHGSFAWPCWPEYAGTDFIIARDGRIAAVYLFFDKLS
jgi:polyisoprenoid-binding protein YceI